MRILVVAAHPDDETLGCGATLLKHAAAGDELHWLITTRTSEPGWPAATVAAKDAEVEAVAAAYGMRSHQQLDFPAAALETVPLGALMGEVREALERVRPEVVYVVHGGDVHTDHRITFDAVTGVAKPLYMGPLGVRRLLCFETLSSTDAAPPVRERAFLPTVLVDVSAHLERKVTVMALYATEAQPDPQPRGPEAIRAQARARGAAMGVRYAEAFMLVREVD